MSNIKLKRIVSQGIIYKLAKYSDASAIATCFFKDFGKLKLFIPKAYSKKRGITKFIPADIDFQKKDESELNKFYNINYDTSKSFYAEVPDIFIRLNILFNIFDIFYPIEEKDEKLYKYMTSINTNNMRRSVIYIINHIILCQGIAKKFDKCENCNENMREIYLSKGSFLCKNCKSSYDAYLSDNKILSSVFSEEFKKVLISKDEELNILKFLIKYLEEISSKRITSLDILWQLS